MAGNHHVTMKAKYRSILYALYVRECSELFFRPSGLEMIRKALVPTSVQAIATDTS